MLHVLNVIFFILLLILFILNVHFLISEDGKCEQKYLASVFNIGSSC
jgi:hypothetical protein